MLCISHFPLASTFSFTINSALDNYKRGNLFINSDYPLDFYALVTPSIQTTKGTCILCIYVRMYVCVCVCVCVCVFVCAYMYICMFECT